MTQGEWSNLIWILMIYDSNAEAIADARESVIGEFEKIDFDTTHCLSEM